MVKFIQEEAIDGEWTDWIRPVETGYKLACCDCSLVHNMDFRVNEDRAEFRVSRNNRSTAQMRRHNKGKQ